MAERPRVSVIVVSYNTRALTLEALRSVRDAAAGVSHEVWVVDNASEDGSVQAVREAFPDASVIALDRNVGFGRANNAAMERARGEHFVLLNSDAAFRRAEDLGRLVERLESDSAIGVVGPRLESEDGEVEYSARRFPGPLREVVTRFRLYRLMPGEGAGRWLLGPYWSHDRVQDADWVTGACMLVRGEVYRAVGGFDPGIFMYGEELEWCHRIREAGWRVVYDPGVVVTHRRGGSGAPTADRLRSALAADLRVVRRRSGWAGVVLFWLVRAAGLLFEAALHGVAGAAAGDSYHRDRGRDAWVTLRAHAALPRESRSARA